MSARANSMPYAAIGAHYAVHLPAPDDFAFWRDRARALIQCDIPPDRVSWLEPGATGDLFAAEGLFPADRRLPAPPGDARAVRANRRFLGVAAKAALHCDPTRFALLYRVLWRLQGKPRLMEDSVDPDIRQLEELAKTVRRDAHKMHAFVRFREIADEDGTAHYVAWFEPDHHIVRSEAGFFLRRFANMRWSILTPRGSIHWDGEVMREGPPARREDAPSGDPVEDLWRSYYASIFNPARLKIGAMLSEMPKKYWKNLPEAELIPALIAGAQTREAAMVKAGAREAKVTPQTSEELAAQVSACRDCPIATCGTRAVMGEGPQDAQKFSGLMIVGEQPGDQEDLAGRVFVGPAGQVLDEYLQTAGINRSAAYLTNAVKHFKFTWKGKHRLHQSPTAKEVDTCRWWLEAERALVKPRIVLALGASAARAMLGRTVSVNRERGVPTALDDGAELWITAHPSYLLRLDGAARASQAARFADDLAAVQARIAHIRA